MGSDVHSGETRGAAVATLVRPCLASQLLWRQLAVMKMILQGEQGCSKEGRGSLIVRVMRKREHWQQKDQLSQNRRKKREAAVARKKRQAEESLVELEIDD